MKFTVITHVEHIIKDNKAYAYAPYVREMNLWVKYVDQLIVLAPTSNSDLTPIHIPYEHDKIKFIEIPKFSLRSFRDCFFTLVQLPLLIFKIFWVMAISDHIHLRCPGNAGFVGAFVQVLFPWKKKTAKYAGNWDPKSEQPIIYRIQKWILRNTILTHNLKVLVYGKWSNETKNVLPFFTATYKEKEKEEVVSRVFNSSLKMLFVGTLSEGKRPLYAIKLVEELKNQGVEIILDIFGDGELFEECNQYIEKNNLKNVFLKGNKNKIEIREALKKSHFLVLPSKSEGWPKVVAEAMFWGCVPLVTDISCVAYMLGYGSRGVLLTLDYGQDTEAVVSCIDNENQYHEMSKEGVLWSRKYTLDYLESEIKRLI